MMAACAAASKVHRATQQPEGIELPVTRTPNGIAVTVPKLDIHTMAVVELEQ
jgi:hypothetical protein